MLRLQITQGRDGLWTASFIDHRAGPFIQTQAYKSEEDAINILMLKTELLLRPVD